jgi:hypothetical protein
MGGLTFPVIHVPDIFLSFVSTPEAIADRLLPQFKEDTRSIRIKSGILK